MSTFISIMQVVHMIRIAVCDDENVIVNQIEHIISEVCKRESIPVNIDVFYSGRLHQEQSMTSSFWIFR